MINSHTGNPSDEQYLAQKKHKLQMRSNLRCLLQATDQEILQDPSLHAPKEESTGVLWLNSKGQHLHFLGCDFHYFFIETPCISKNND